MTGCERPPNSREKELTLHCATRTFSLKAHNSGLQWVYNQMKSFFDGRLIKTPNQLHASDPTVRAYFEKIISMFAKLSATIEASLVQKKPVNRKSEAGDQCSNTLLAAGNTIMMGHFPRHLNVVFIQASNPAKKYASYFFQRGTQLWNKLAEFSKCTYHV